MADNDVRQACGICAAEIFEVYYDPTAQASYVACAECGSVFHLDD